MKNICTASGCREFAIAKGWCRLHYGRMRLTGRLDRVERPPNGPTEQEKKVLKMIALGLCNKETAALLGVSIKTVEKHRASLYKKLNFQCGVHVAHYCLHHGIIKNLYEPA